MEYSLTTKKILNSGIEIPLLGLGTWLSKGKDCGKAVKCALEEGYRHIDTASYYGNEKNVGDALKKSEVPREDIFLTTKLWNSDHGYDNCLKAIDKSLELLQVDYVDLYLIHWPVSGKRIETWRAMEKILEMGKAKSIGVSNYMIKHLDELFNALDQNDDLTIPPVVNQVENHPFQFRKDLFQYCRKKNIQYSGYSPLARTEKFDNPIIQNLSEKYNKSPAQIMIRWAIQHDIVSIPKSINPQRIKENCEIFDFCIGIDDMMVLDSLNEGHSVVTWDPLNDEMFD